MKRLGIPVPPRLAELFGYGGTANLVAFYWEPAGSELAWNDGQMSMVGANGWAWIDYHRAFPALLELNLGDDENEAEEWLLFNRAEEILFAGPRDEILQILRDQPHPDMFVAQQLEPYEEGAITSWARAVKLALDDRP